MEYRKNQVKWGVFVILLSFSTFTIYPRGNLTHIYKCSLFRNAAFQNQFPEQKLIQLIKGLIDGFFIFRLVIPLLLAIGTPNLVL